MDNSFRQQEPDTQQPNSFLSSLRFFDGILHWLSGLIQLTEEEQHDAGIYLDNQSLK